MAKLLVVIVNGLRSEALQCAHVPCFDRLVREGVLAPRVQALPSDPNLAAFITLFSSLPPEEHGVFDICGGKNQAGALLSLFAILRYQHRSASVFYSCDRLRMLFPAQALQTALFINSQGIRNVDRELAGYAGTHLQKEKPDLCVLALQGTDIARIHFGLFSDPYLESVEQVDQLLSLLLEQLTEVGLQEEYVISVIGIHGSSPKSEERVKEQAICLPWLLSGPGIARGIVADRKIPLVEVAPTMAHILGVAPHPDWWGRAAEDLFLPMRLIASSRQCFPDDEGVEEAAMMSGLDCAAMRMYCPPSAFSARAWHHGERGETTCESQR